MTRRTPTTLTVWILVGLAATLWVVSRLESVVTPLVVAWFVAYVLDPAVDRLEKCRFPRTAAVLTLLATVFAGATLATLLIAPTLAEQVKAGAQAFPRYAETLRDLWGPRLEALLGRPIPEHTSTVLAEAGQALQEYLPQLAKAAPAAVGRVFANAWSMVSAVLGLAIVPVFAFYLLVDFNELGGSLVALFPRRAQDTVRRLLDQSDEVLGAFVRGQLTVCAVLAGVYSVGLSFTGIDMPWVVGTLSGVLFVVPYLGTLVGIVVGSVLALLKFQDLVHLLGVWGVFAAGQALEGFVLTPRIVGDRVGLNPIAVIVALLAGGELFGAVGVLLAVPGAAVLRVAVREGLTWYRRSDFYRE